MTAPVVSKNTLSAPVVNPGGTSTWTTEATDADARSVDVSRTVTDSTGNVTVFTSTLVVSDPLTYGLPTSNDPKVSFSVSPTDPTKVTVTVAP